MTTPPQPDGGYPLAGEQGAEPGASAASGSGLASSLVSGARQAAGALAAGASRLGSQQPGQGAISNDTFMGRMANRQAYGVTPGQAIKSKIYSSPPELSPGALPPSGSSSDGNGGSDFINPPKPDPEEGLFGAAQAVTGASGAAVTQQTQAAPAQASSSGSVAPGESAAAQAMNQATRAGSAQVGQSSAPTQAMSPMVGAPPAPAGGVNGLSTSHAATAMPGAPPNPSASANSVLGQSLADRQRTQFGQVQ